MKIFLLFAVIILTSSCVVARNFTIGSTANADLVLNELKRFAYNCTRITKMYNYKQRENRKIRAINAVDLVGGATTKILQGGLNHTYVQLKMEGAPCASLKFRISVYVEPKVTQPLTAPQVLLLVPQSIVKGISAILPHIVQTTTSNSL